MSVIGVGREKWEGSTEALREVLEKQRVLSFLTIRVSQGLTEGRHSVNFFIAFRELIHVE